MRRQPKPGHSSRAGRFLLSAAVGLVAFAMAQAALAAPITFSTALPVPKGEWIVRIQSRYLRSTDDPSSLDRELDVFAFPVVGVYGATQKLALFAIAPILDKDLDITTPLGRRTRSVSGLGDVTLLARYTAYQRDAKGKTFRVAPFVAVEAPTGEDGERDALGELPRPLQLGSGSWDVTFGTVVTRQTLAWQVDAALSYKANTEAKEFEFGDVARLDLSYQRRLWPQELGEGVPAFLYGVLESNLVWSDHNVAAGRRDPDSGGTTWHLAPGVQYVTRRFVVEGAVQIPVVQDLNGQALENDFVTTLSVRVNF